MTVPFVPLWNDCKLPCEVFKQTALEHLAEMICAYRICFCALFMHQSRHSTLPGHRDEHVCHISL